MINFYNAQDTKTQIVILLLVSNLIISIGLFTYSFFVKKQRKSLFLMLSVLSILCPIVVPVSLSAIRILNVLMNALEIDKEDVTFDQTRETSIENSNVEVEMNFTSLSEAQTFSNVKDLRRLIMNVLKSNPAGISNVMRKLIDHNDTEASHYAAVAVQENLKEFREQIAEIGYQAELHPEDPETNIRLLGIYAQEMELDYFSEEERKKYVYAAEEIADQLYSHNLWHMLALHYFWIVKMLLCIKDQHRARIWMDRCVTYRPDDIETFKCQLLYYYDTHDSDAFMTSIEAFKRSTITADKEMLDLIRFYQ